MRPHRWANGLRRCVAASVPALLFFWHLPIAAQDCDSLDRVRENARSNFSKIIGAKLENDGEYLSSLTLPNAHRCVIEIYSRTEAKYSCEWVVAKERGAEAAVRGIFDEFVNDLAQCALGKNDVVREKRKNGRGEQAYFPDARYPRGDVRAFLRLEYDYSSPWWLMEMVYYVGGEK